MLKRTTQLLSQFLNDDVITIVMQYHVISMTLKLHLEIGAIDKNCPEHLSHARAIQFAGDNELVVLDGRMIKVFDQTTGRFLRQFGAWRPNGRIIEMVIRKQELFALLLTGGRPSYEIVQYDVTRLALIKTILRSHNLQIFQNLSQALDFNHLLFVNSETIQEADDTLHDSNAVTAVDISTCEAKKILEVRDNFTSYHLPRVVNQDQLVVLEQEQSSHANHIQLWNLESLHNRKLARLIDFPFCYCIHAVLVHGDQLLVTTDAGIYSLADMTASSVNWESLRPFEQPPRGMEMNNKQQLFVACGDRIRVYE